MRRSRPADTTKGLKDLSHLQTKIASSPSVDARALDPVVAHLARGQVPTLGEPVVSAYPKIKLALSCFRILHTCTDRHLETNSSLVTRVCDLAPDLWEWSNFIISNYMESGPFSKLLPPLVLASVTATLGPLCQTSSFQAALRNRTGAYDIAAQCWLEEYNISKSEDRQSFTRLLAVIEKDNRGLSAGVLDPLLRAADGSHRTIARVALRYLRYEYEDHNVAADTSHLWSILLLIFSMASPDDEDRRMVDSLLSAGAMRELLRCLSSLNSQPRWKPSTRYPADTQRHSIMACFMLIQHCWSASSNNYRWMSQALENDVLQIAPRSAELIGHDYSLIGSFTRIVDMVSTFMVFRPLIRIVANKLERNALPKKLNSSLTPIWSAFLELLDQRRVSKEYFKEDYKYTCTACQRDLLGLADLLKECSGCRGVRYCSVQCQKEHWPEHRRICLEYQESLLDATYTPLPRLDEVFILFLSRLEVEARTGQISTAIAKDYPRMPVCELNIRVDWRLNPPKISVQTLSEVHGRDALVRWRAMDGHTGRMHFTASVLWGADGTTLTDTMPCPDGLINPA